MERRASYSAGVIQALSYELVGSLTPTQTYQLTSKQYVDSVGVKAVLGNNSTNYTVALTDQNKFLNMVGGQAITITLPSNATVAFPISAEIDFFQANTGQITFVAGAGATVLGTPGLKTRAQYSAVTAKKIYSDTWALLGDLSP